MGRGSRISDLTSSEKAYLIGRLAYTVIMPGILAVWLVSAPSGEPLPATVVAAIILSIVGGAAMLGAVHFIGLWPATAVWLALPFDLVTVLLLALSPAEFAGAGYTIAFAIPVVYASVVRRRPAWMVAGATAVVYVAGQAIAAAGADLPIVSYFHFVSSLAIVIVTYIVADGFDRLVTSERNVVQARERAEELNTQLQQKVTELQAVSEISEIIHSDLDFDHVGPFIIQILEKVLDVPLAHIFVMDKVKGETIFMASSSGLGGASRLYDRPVLFDTAGGGGGLDSHFSCIPILEHDDIMVAFCAESDRVEHLSFDDRMVLQAVASELAVAVENSQLYKLTRTLAITDELSGLHNYRYLKQRLDDEMERSKRYEKHLSLLMLDVDDFKDVNDSHGHIAGDSVIRELAELLLTHVREVDVVARYGGEEFSVLLPETDAAGAFVVAEKIRDAVARHRFRDADGAKRIRMTVSVGFSTFPAHSHDKESLLRQADDALYQAKHSGKDRVRSPRSRLTVIQGRPHGEKSEGGASAAEDFA